MITPLERLGQPLAFAVEGAELDAPRPRLGQAHRTRVRSLDGMQKEALVTADDGRTWRLASDEGEYLDGDDIAPAPLAFMTTGVVSSFATELLALAEQRDVDIGRPTLVLDSYYTMNGSALAGTMTGGALSPELEIRPDPDADVGPERLRRLAEQAVMLSPVTGLLTGEHHSVFSLTLNGKPVAPDRVAELDRSRLPDPVDAFEAIDRVASERDPPVIHRTGRKTDPLPEADSKYTSGEGSSLQEEQDRVLHLRGVCTVHEDGLKRIEMKLFSPIGTVFELLSELPKGAGGRGRAPDAMTYVAAGLGFCFMTQVGRYADIVDTPLEGYRIVQDTHVSLGGASGGTGEPGEAEPVETHLFFETAEGAAVAREVLDMGEQTCFLHALCRTPLEAPTVAVVGE